MLQSPKSGKAIGVYLAHKNEVSSVLFVHQSGKPIYSISKKLVGTELRYLALHKLALALVHSARRLQYYFQGLTTKVYTEYSMKKIF